MRQVLVDYVREQRSQKRGGGASPVSLEATLSIPGISEDPIDVLDIHEALARLEEFDERKARVLELRFFVGMNTDEIAVVLGISAVTVARDVRTSMAWLRTQLTTHGS